MKKIRKNLFKICVFILAFMCFYTVTTVDATGYTYDHKGNVIYSTEGFTVNETPYIYSSLGISDSKYFSNPADLFVYTKERTGIESNPYKTIIYLLDGGNTITGVNPSLFVLNSSLQVEYQIDHFLLDTSKFTDDELINMMSGGKHFLDMKVSELDEEGNAVEVAKYSSVADIREEGIINVYMNGASSIFRMYKTNTTPYTDYIYICDTNNGQILVLDNESFDETNCTYDVVQVITSPVEELGENVSFRPTNVTVDDAGRIYATANGVTNGIMQFSIDGTFDRYIGTNYVTMSAWDIFWRNFATEAQLAKQTSITPTTFTSISYFNRMIYATSKAISNTDGTTNDTIMIKKINPSGKDVLRRNGYTIPKGDFAYFKTNDANGTYGPSTLEAIAINEYGIYTVVDSNRGRLFTYDNEGNLLYISGGTGTQIDKISSPKAVQYLGENIIVLDYNKKTITVFEPTDIAKVINKAVECEFNGRDDGFIDEDGKYVYGAFDYWKEVVLLNANYEYAYVGIGKHYMNNNEYKTAMEYFQLGYDVEYYGKAYKQYRDSVIKKWFAPVVIVVLVLIVGLLIYNRIRRKKLGIKKEVITGIGDE